MDNIQVVNSLKCYPYLTLYCQFAILVVSSLTLLPGGARWVWLSSHPEGPSPAKRGARESRN